MDYRFALMGLLVTALPTSVGVAQGPQAAASIGLPFGVAYVSVPLSAENADEADFTHFALKERNGRTFYPAFVETPLLNLLGSLLGAERLISPSSTTAFFLFVGDEPLQLTVYTPQPQGITITPRRLGGITHKTLMLRWWREYNEMIRQQRRATDYPPLVETYLTTMLSRRLSLPPTLMDWLEGQNKSFLPEGIELMVGVDRQRAELLKEASLGRGFRMESASRPMPEAIRWAPLGEPEVADDVRIEPISMRVPEDCFYVRFNGFDHLAWFGDLFEDYDGDIARMVIPRGHAVDLNDRLERQLAVEQNIIAELLGDKLLVDAAFLGRDMYFREGAAMGLLLQAKNSLLGTVLTQYRNAVLLKESRNGATLETVNIAGRDVSLLATPDNGVRAFYVADGDYHLVTTSREMARRFLETAEGVGSLGATAEFGHARSQMPSEPNQAVFAYFSSEFFRGLASPQYQVELRRRLLAVNDLELVQAAFLAARAEGLEAETVEQLMAGDFLPEGFGQRPDGSGPTASNGVWIDSQRGARGAFTPICDAEIAQVTPTEYASVSAKAAYYEDTWKQFDPLFVSVRRSVCDAEGREELTIDAMLSPLDEAKFGWVAALLGPPSPERVTPGKDDVVWAEAAFEGGLLERAIPPHHLFLGIQDSIFESSDADEGPRSLLDWLRWTSGYLGAWPSPGLLDVLFGGGSVNGPEPAQLLLGLWRQRVEDVSVIGFDKDIVVAAANDAVVSPSDHPAHLRVHVEDLTQTRLGQLLNRTSEQKARRISQGNGNLLGILMQQLRVAPEQALDTAEQLINASLICPLAGQYALVEDPIRSPRWSSSVLQGEDTPAGPTAFTAPPMRWFRGFDLHVAKNENKLVAHATVQMQRPVRSNGPMSLFQLPWRNLKSEELKETSDAVAP